MESNAKIIKFILLLTSIVALGLTGLREATKDRADRNEEIFNKRAVLKAIDSKLEEGKKVADFSDLGILDVFDHQMEQVVVRTDGSVIDSLLAEDVDMEKEKKKPEEERNLPLFIYNNGGEKYYILSLRGNGLWDEIWGYIALESDLNTIAGASFDHKGETPGLGGEIKDNPNFPKQFIGKKIYDEDGKYVSVLVKKGGAEKGNPHQVDAISGATITSRGVTEMLHRGIKYYQAYFDKIKKQ